MCQLVFYKGKGKFFDKVIRWQTKSKYSHVAVVIDGTCFEADAWAGRVRSRAWDSHYNPENWEIVEVSLDKDKAWQFLVEQVDKRYDYFGIVGFVLPWKVQITNWWYCSELTAAVMGLETDKVSPGDLAEKYVGHR